MKSRIVVIGIAALAAIAVGVGIRLLMPMFVDSPTKTTGTALVGGPFELVDQTGAVRRDTDFRGRHMLIYFGYNYCPDVCPTTLFAMTTALDSLDADKAAQIQPIYVTVDPARDTVAEMRIFAENFHPDLVALTGSDAQVAAAAKAYRVYFAKAGDGEDYLVDHSSFVYLMDPGGGFVRHFSHTASAEEMASALDELL